MKHILRLQSLERRRADNETFFIHKSFLGKIRAQFLLNKIIMNQSIHSLRIKRPLRGDMKESRTFFQKFTIFPEMVWRETLKYQSVRWGTFTGQ